MNQTPIRFAVLSLALAFAVSACSGDEPPPANGSAATTAGADAPAGD